MTSKTKAKTVKPIQSSKKTTSVKSKKELIEIAPYQVAKVKVVPFQTRTIAYVVWILIGAFLISLTIIFLVKFLG